MRLFPVATADLDRVWPIVVAWLERAQIRTDSDATVDALRALCTAEAAVLVLIGDDPAAPVAAGVVQTRVYARGARACWILALGGARARAWRHTLDALEAGARADGCDRLEFVGRPGWAGLLPGYACQAQYVKRL